MEVFKLFGSIFIDNDKANKSLAKTDKKGQGVGKTLGKGIKTAAKWGAAVVAGAGVAAGAMLGMANKTAQATDRIDKLSQRLGLSREGFQEWEFVMSQAGVSIDTVQSGMKTLSQRMGDALNGAGKGAELFKELGVTITDSMSQEDVFNETITALQGMEDGVKKADLAQQLFGRTGQNLLPLLNDTANNTEALKEKARELGLVLSDDAIDAGVVFTDTMDQAKRSLSAFGLGIGSEIMPIVQQMLDWFIAHMPQIKETIGNVFNVVGTIISSVSGVIKNYLFPAFQEMWNWIAPYMPQIKQFFMDAFTVATEVINGTIDVIKDIVDWIKEHEAVLIPLVAGILGAVIAFNLISGAITLWTTITTLATGAATLFGTAIAFLTSPIGIVVLVIGALIAIGVLLYKNWDKIKATAIELWGKIKEVFNGIKESVTEKIRNAIDFVKGKFTDLKDKVMVIINFIKHRFAQIKEAVMAPFRKGIDWAKNKMNQIKYRVSNIVSRIKQKFASIKSAITSPFKKAIDWVTDKIDKFKSKLGGMFSAKIKMPKFSFTGSLNPVKWPKQGLPKLKVKWNAIGGMMTSPTIFGGMGNTLFGGGEAGNEGIVPLQGKHMFPLADAIAKRLDNKEKQPITLNFYPKNLTEADMEMAFNYVDRRFGMGLA